MNFGAFSPHRTPIRTTLQGMLILTGFAIGGCKSLPGAASMPDNATPCPDTRPQTCTMEYKPVIGYTENGEDQGVFSNHCSACSEKGIAWTLPKDERE